MDFSHYNPLNLIPYAVALLAWWGYHRWGRERLPRARMAVNTTGVIVLLRLLITDNPAVYAGYAHIIEPPEDASYFAASIASLRSGAFYREVESTPFLAMGSSQTGAIYRPEHQGEMLRTLTYAGMQPAEFPFLKDVIDAHNPSTILLYLSTFDLSSRVATEALPLVPGSVWQLGDVWWLYENFHHTGALGVFRCAVAWTLEEYQHQEIFKGVRDHLFGAYDALHQFDAVGAESDYWERQDVFIEMSGEVYIAAHVRYLEMFAEQHRGRRIIILEGHYHPDLYAKQAELHAQVREALSGFAERTANVEFVPLEALYPLGPEAYFDGYHVTHEAGLRFVEFLFREVLKEPVP